MKRSIAFLALAAADVAVLTAGRPRFETLARGLCAPHAWLRHDGTDAVLTAVAAAALWLAALWLACGLVAVAATGLPGAAGRAAKLVSSRLLPAAVRRLVVGSAGLTVLVAPVAAGAAAHPAHHAVATTATALPSPSWPVDQPPSHPVPAPRWPASPPVERPARPQAAARDAIRVRAGDSLWAIAARRLGPPATPDRIAAEWPRWYATNRSVIGPDPAVIQPGQVLHVPQDRS